MSNKLTGNKGDWSELYVLASLLADGVLFQSDEQYNKDENHFYKIIKVYHQESKSTIEFERTDKILIFQIKKNERVLLGELDIEYFKIKSKEILDGIKAGEGRKFNIPEANDFIQKIFIEKLTALNSTKADILLRIYDHKLAKQADLGFSIKSLIGSDSTLFNPGDETNFIYEIENKNDFSLAEFNKLTYKPGGKKSKITERLKKIKENGLQINFSSIQSSKLSNNLKMVDGDLPKILAHALLIRWLYQEKSLKGVIKILENSDPLEFYLEGRTTQKMYEYKLVRFLVECAMGLTSETIWEGKYDATGGVILVKKEGEIVCFHVYDFNLLRKYLLERTYFEQPATGESSEIPGTRRIDLGTKDSKSKNYFYGWLYEEKDKLFFKINLQIRFS